MDENQILKKIQALSNKLPKFKDGRINYTDSVMAPIVLVFVKYRGKFLLVKRSKKVLHYNEMWNAVSGYMDELKPLRKKAIEEIKQELGIKEVDIGAVTVGKSYSYEDKEIDKIWLICPVMVSLSKRPTIKLDYENSEYRWIAPEEITQFNTPPGLKETFAEFAK